MSVKASIDIGTNSTRLLIAKQNTDLSVTPIVMTDIITRLGTGFDQNGNFSKESMQRVINTILDYKQIIQQYNAEKTFVFATSATRDANNRDEFLAAIENQSGYTPLLLSGDQEAVLSFKGAISDLDINGKYLVCDIGGGSTEFIYAHDQKILQYKSLNIGSRRLTTRFIKNDPVTNDQAGEMRSFIKSALQAGLEPFNADSIIFVGGTATTLSLINQGIDIKYPEKSHNTIINIKNIQNISNRLFVKTIQERKLIKGLHPDRCDVIFTGATLVHTIMDHFNVLDARVSLRDLMFGILLQNEKKTD